MIATLKIVYEAIRQAFDSMIGNKLRTFLSLLGVTIGIFCIIAVKSAVDSLQDSIVSGFNELGSDVLYIDKMPWGEDPGENYWKYARRPDPSYKDYEVISSKSDKITDAAFTVFTGGKTIKYKSSFVNNAFIMGSTFEYNRIQNLNIIKGRYFTPQEYRSGSNKLILGAKVAESLFGIIEPVGQKVKLFGQEYLVIGSLEPEGENMFNFLNFDDVIWVSFNNIKKFVNTNENSNIGRMLNVKIADGEDIKIVKGELTGILRANRKLAPREDNDFSINELSMLSAVLDQVFGVINIAGFLIGFFALVIGMFSVANIMFVSVKERTSLIGIKKAIGANANMIMLEFLIEAVILCVLGGLIGIGLVYVILKIIAQFIPFNMGLSMSNVVIGVAASVIVGIIAGIIPANKAAHLDPVEAIRS